MIDNKGLLAKHSERLSGAQFEEFCVAWLEATREKPMLGGIIKNVQIFGAPGEKQDGIDIFCDVLMPEQNGKEARTTRIVFQCKRVKNWSEAKTKEAIQKMTFPADECVLVLAIPKKGAIQRVIEEHNQTRRTGAPVWQVWFMDEIQQHIVTDLKDDLGARLLTAFFGSAVSRDLIDLDSASPLLLPSAKFAGNTGALRHERNMLGRETEVQCMLDFLADDSKRALILSAEGGQGKTRLLRELARNAADQQPSRCVRWLDECLPETLDEALQRLPRMRQWIIMLDDVHRWENTPARLFEKLLRQGTRLKIVIGTRPQRRNEIENALIQTGCSASSQERLATLRPLPRKLLREIAKEALESRWQDAVGHLVNASEGNLLILQLGADYLNSCQEASINLHTNPNFRRDVLAGLINEKAISWAVGPVSQAEVGELLDVFSILSSAPLDHDTEQKIAGFIGLSGQNFKRIVNQLKEAGHLEIQQEAHDQKRRLRLMPDVLSDYRACAACYDDAGDARDLSGRLWQALGQPHALLPAMLRNLSEAEYLARHLWPGAPKITAPLTQALRSEYASAGWRRRAELLGTWKSVAEFHPIETLWQIRQVIQLGDDKPREKPTEIERLFPSVSSIPDFHTLLESCAETLAIIGVKHPAHVPECLDILWEISGGNASRHLDKVAEICSLSRRGPTSSAEAGIKWIRSRILDARTLPAQNQLGGLLEAMLAWAFHLRIRENEWVDERTIEFRETHRSLTSTRHLRQAALEIVDSWLKSPLLPARLAAAGFFRYFLVTWETGVLASQGGRAKDRQAWQNEEAAAIEKLRRVIESTQDAATLWMIRNTLVQNLPYALQKPSVRHAIHEILEDYPDSFELRMHRLLLSSNDSDVWHSEAKCARLAEIERSIKALPAMPLAEVNAEYQHRLKKWNSFVQSVTAEIVQRLKSADELHDFLVHWKKTTSMAGQPDFRQLLAALKDMRPEWLASLAKAVIEHDSDALDCLMLWLLNLAPPEHEEAWSLQCLRHERQSLKLSALQALRLRKDISPEEWTELRVLAAHVSPNVRIAVLRWAENAFDTDAGQMPKVFEVLAAMPLDPKEKDVVETWVGCINRWIGVPFPLDGIPHGDAQLAKLLPFPTLQDYKLDTLVTSWSRHAPDQCMRLLEARIAQEAGKPNSDYRALPYSLNLESLEAVAEIQIKMNGTFETLKPLSLERDEQRTCTLTTWFKTLAHGAWKHYISWLEGRLEFLSGHELLLALEPVTTGTSFAFRHPDLTEKVLLKAAHETHEVKRQIRSLLLESIHPGMHSYQPGVPRSHDLANREKALELSRQHRGLPLLHEFYHSVMEMSEREIEAARREET